MSETYPTIKIVQKDYTRKDGTRNVFIRLTIDRKPRYYPINVFVCPAYFKSGLVSRGDPVHKRKNNLIKQSFLKADQILYDYRIQDKQLTFQRFREDFTNNTYGSNSFYDFYEAQVKILSSKLEPGTIACYNSQLIKLKEFRKDITFNDIDLNFIAAYEGFIKTKKGNNKNTIIKSITYIKSILNRALDQGVIKDNPIQKYKLQSIVGNRQYLSIDELRHLKGLYYNNKFKPSKANVLRYFLFCCYTGLRYQDVRNLRFKDIQGKQFISIQMIKTKEFVKIPLTQDAKKLIPEGSFNNQKVFKVLTGQPTNRYLKEIMKDAGITKSISFHCARHTFATVSKSMGIDYDVISKMLGHTDIKTTKIYTRYELDYLSREMEKWN